MLRVVPVQAEDILFNEGDVEETGNSLFIVYDGQLQAIAQGRGLLTVSKWETSDWEADPWTFTFMV